MISWLSDTIFKDVVEAGIIYVSIDWDKLIMFMKQKEA